MIWCKVELQLKVTNNLEDCEKEKPQKVPTNPHTDQEQAAALLVASWGLVLGV